MYKENYIEKEVKEFKEKTLFLKIRRGDGIQILPIEENDRDILILYFQQTLQRSYQAGIEQGRKNRDEEVLEWVKKTRCNAGIYAWASLDKLKTFINKEK